MNPVIQITVNPPLGYYVYAYDGFIEPDRLTRTFGPMSMTSALIVAAEQFGYSVDQNQTIRNQITVLPKD